MPPAPRTNELTWADVRRRRLAAHRLVEPAPPDELAEVVGAVCGIHAQLVASAELAIGLRVRDATRETVRGALWVERSLVRTYGLRGTIHVFPADELASWLAALRALPPPNAARRLESIEVTRDQADQIVDAIGAALVGRRLSLTELEQAVAERLGDWVAARHGQAFVSGWSRVRSFIGDAALAGTLCFGPNVGTKVTFVRPEDWLGRQDDVEREVALATLVRRYLGAYGPATETDFREWTATSTAAAKAAFDTVRDELVEVSVEGRRGWWVQSAIDAIGATGTARRSGSANVQLLPHFDSYLVGCRPRDVLVPPPVLARVADRGLERYDLHSPLPILLVDGEVAGLWRRTARTRSVTIRVEPLVALTPAIRRAIETAVERVGSVLERTAELEIGTVEARPHL